MKDLSRLSEEERLREGALSLQDPFSRAVFLKLAASAGAALAVPSLASAGRMASASRRAGSKTGLIINQTGTLDVVFFKSYNALGFDRAAKQLGLKSQDIFTNYDATKELAQVKGLPTQGAKMLTNVPSDEGPLPNLARICQANGIYYMNVFTNPAWFTAPDVGKYWIGFLAPDFDNQSYGPSKVLFQAMGGKGKVLYLGGRPGTLDALRTQGFVRAAKEFPGITWVKRSTSWDAVTGRSVLQNMLPAHPDATAIYAQNDSILYGAITVVNQQKLKHLLASAGDGIPESIPYLKSGRITAMTGIGGPWQAGFSVVQLFDALNGYQRLLPETLLLAGGVLLTKDTVGAYEQAMYKASAPFDWAKMSRTLNPKTWDTQWPVRPMHPNEYWAGQPKTLPLNPVWNTAGTKAAIERSKKEWKAHFTKGPLPHSTYIAR